MPFGFTDDNDGHSISKAIYEAVDDSKGSILFFAAATSDSRANTTDKFPARHECVMSIRATDSRGKFLDFNPRMSPESMALGTLGLDVPCGSSSQESGEICRSGTSVAAAVATGMAAMLLGYVETKSSEAAYQDVSLGLRRRQGMLNLLERIASPSATREELYVAPWKLETMDDEERWALFQSAVRQNF
jgi:hypothetical protein